LPIHGLFIGEDISTNSIRAEVETITRMFLHAYPLLPAAIRQ
jgi:hypothetical protein